MAEIESLVYFLESNFGPLDEITDEWVESSIDSNYTDFEGVSAVISPSFYDNDDFVDRLISIRKAVYKWELKNGDTLGWKELGDQGVNGRRIGVLLWFPIQLALVKNSPLESLRAGTAAACSYFALASLHGALAYKIFNSYLYMKCLELFRNLYRILIFDSREAQTKKKLAKGRGGKAGKMASRRANDTHFAYSQENGDEGEMVHLDKREVSELLEDCTEALFTLLNKVPLSGFSEAARLTAEFVREIIQLDFSKETKTIMMKTAKEFRELTRMSDRSFALMHRLAEDRHGEGGKLVYAHIVYPRLGFWTFHMEAMATIPATFTLLKDLMVKFIKERCITAKKQELDMIFTILTNLYARCTDKQDYRVKVSNTVVEVLALLPKDYHYEFSQCLNAFAISKKNSYRNFTIEIVPALLRHPDIDFSGPDPNPTVEEDPTADNVTKAKKSKEKKKKPKSKKKNTAARHADDDDDDEEDHDAEGEEDVAQEEEEAVEEEEIDSEEERDRARIAARNRKKRRRLPPRMEPLPALYGCYIRYCLDKSSNLRARAIIYLSNILLDPVHRDGVITEAKRLQAENPQCFSWVKHIDDNQLTAEEKEDLKDMEIKCDKEYRRLQEKYPEKNKALTEVKELKYRNRKKKMKPLCDNLIVNIIVRALRDEKANVRRSALIALQVFFPSLVDIEEVRVAKRAVKQCTIDGSLMVRKQALETLNLIYHNAKPEFRERMAKSWMKNLLIMVKDQETSVQNAAAKVVIETLLHTMMGEGDTPDTTWLLLEMMEERDDRRLLLHNIYYVRNDKDTIVMDKKLIDCLHKKLEKHPDRSNILWMLISQLSVVQKFSPKKALDAWISFDTNSFVYDKLATHSSEPDRPFILFGRVIEFTPEEMELCRKNVTDARLRIHVTTQARLRTSRDEYSPYIDNELNRQARYLLDILGHCSEKLSTEQKEDLIKNLQDRILSSSVRYDLIPDIYYCIAKLMDACGAETKGVDEMQKFSRMVLEKCRNGLKTAYRNIDTWSRERTFIKGTLKEGDEIEKQEDDLRRVLTTIGEALMISPKLIDVSYNLIEVVKYLLIHDPVIWINRANSYEACMNSRPVSNMTDVPSSQSNGQSSQPYSQPCSQPCSQPSSQPFSQPTATDIGSQKPIIPVFRKLTLKNSMLAQYITEATKSLAAITMGKICIVDDRYAEQLIPAFVRFLKDCKSAHMRNNTVVIITDLCIRYTSLIDQYSHVLAACMNDECSLVRKTAMFCLTSLLKEQYIRWEGQIMYRAVSMVLDIDPDARKFAIFCLKEILMPQYPHLFSQHLIQCLFYFNHVKMKFSMDDDEDEMTTFQFNMQGDEHAKDRMRIYSFMLDTFDDKTKLWLMTLLCAQVLSPVMRGEFDYADDNVRHLMVDAFKIMSCKAMKLKIELGRKKTAGGDDEEEQPELPKALVTEVKQIITDSYRKMIIENIIPTLIEIKTYLTERRSIHVRECMAVFREICKAHQDKIDEFLAGDRQLKADIEFDIKRLEASERADRERAEREKQEKEEARKRRLEARKSRQAAADGNEGVPTTEDIEQEGVEPMESDVDAEDLLQTAIEEGSDDIEIESEEGGNTMEKEIKKEVEESENAVDAEISKGTGDHAAEIIEGEAEAAEEPIESEERDEEAEPIETVDKTVNESDRRRSKSTAAESEIEVKTEEMEEEGQQMEVDEVETEKLDGESDEANQQETEEDKQQDEAVEEGNEDREEENVANPPPNESEKEQLSTQPELPTTEEAEPEEQHENIAPKEDEKKKFRRPRASKIVSNVAKDKETSEAATAASTVARKRTREWSTADSNDSIPSRQVSTPNKALNNVTFRDLNMTTLDVSAIDFGEAEPTDENNQNQ